MKELSWIRVARNYIGVKEIPGKRNNPIIVRWLINLKAWWREDETPWCLTGDTEVLTNEGFIRLDKIKEINPSKVAQLNPNTNQIEYVDKYGYIEKDYEGKVYDVKSGKLDFTCDPKHKLYGSFSSSNKYQLREVSSLTKYGVNIPNISSSSNKEIYSDTQIKLLAVFLSDGYIKGNQLRVHVSKQRKIDILRTLPVLKELKETKVYGISKDICINFIFDKDLLPDVFEEYKILTWEFISNISQRQAKIFIDTYSQFDGTSNNSSYELCTASKELQEQLLFIANMAGYKATPFKSKQTNKLSKIKYLYYVYVALNTKHRNISKKHLKEKSFKGKLYCLQVPSSIMIIRCRNGVIIPIGNCGVFVAECLKEVNRTYPKHWYRAKGYLDYGTKLDRPAYGCLVIFDRKGGGHVGFCVGKNPQGQLLILGGNQANAVNIKAFSSSRIVGYRWCVKQDEYNYPSESRYDLPVINEFGLSENES